VPASPSFGGVGPPGILCGTHGLGSNAGAVSFLSRRGRLSPACPSVRREWDGRGPRGPYAPVAASRGRPESWPLTASAIATSLNPGRLWPRRGPGGASHPAARILARFRNGKVPRRGIFPPAGKLVIVSSATQSAAPPRRIFAHLRQERRSRLPMGHETCRGHVLPPAWIEWGHDTSLAAAPGRPIDPEPDSGRRVGRAAAHGGRSLCPSNPYPHEVSAVTCPPGRNQPGHSAGFRTARIMSGRASAALRANFARRWVSSEFSSLVRRDSYDGR
jgi:hypothetical protein